MSNSGHQRPYHDQNWLESMCPVAINSATMPTPMRMMGPTTEGTRGPPYP
jgi:hypothetical protein